MNRNSLGMALACLISGALGAFGLSLLATPAEARGGVAFGKPFVVQVAPAPAMIGSPSSFSNPSAGIIYRVWSDGTLDAVAYFARCPLGFNSQPSWEALCDPDAVSPAMICLQPLGVIPDDPATPADVNGDGKVDAADLGLVLSDWSGAPAAR